MKRPSAVLSLSLLSALSVCLPLSPARADEDQSIDPPSEIMNKPSPVLSPEEALKAFTVEEGFEIQLVAAEPLVEDPVAMTFDEDGRLWVCEMRGYMPDQYANGEEEPTGMIVVLEDTDGDGVMDKRTVFLDKIVLPRAIAIVKNGILYADYQTLYFVRVNSNGSAGARIPVDRAYSNNGGAKSNVEHQANGLLYGLDNWFYNAKSSRRYKQIGTRFRRGDTEFRGQWGITQDDDGRLLANRNPVLIEYELFHPSTTIRNENFNFNDGRVRNQQGILRVKPDVYPIVPTPGVNRAYRKAVVDHESWKLKVATAACGPVIYRAGQFPDAYYNNVFIPEPAGNLVKRIVLDNDGSDKPSAAHAYEGKEFIVSTDERNRFVNANIGPDGALYLVDMYRGLIQHQTYISKYLRRQIAARELDKPLGYGRIYRVVHKDSPIDHAAPKLSELTSVQLVERLGHVNAWHRMTAQRLLVQRKDESSVRPLEVMATSDANPQARIHALWALEGMRELTPAVLAAAGESDNPRVRVQVLRLSEAYEGEPDAKRFVALMKRYVADEPTWALDLQLASSAGVLASLDTPDAYDVLLAVLDRREGEALLRHAVISGLEGKEAVMLAKVGDRPIKDQLFKALVKATENGGLTIGSLLELVDSPDFAEKRTEMLGELAKQAVQQEREDVIRQLIDRMAQPDAEVAMQQTILQGMSDGRDYLSSPAELDGKPELFEQWAQTPPADATVAELAGKLDEIFIYEKTLISADVAAQIERGKLLYSAHCSTCHGEDGKGLEGGGPPIAGADWAGFEPEVLAMLILNGAEGDIMVNGKLYTAPAIQQVMTGFKHAPISDQDIADTLTFIRSKDFSNNYSPVDAELVAKVRADTADRETPYNPAQLMKIEQSLKESRGVTFVATKGPATELVQAGWLKQVNAGLVYTLLGVTVPLVLLLGLTIFGAMTKPEYEPGH